MLKTYYHNVLVVPKCLLPVRGVYRFFPNIYNGKLSKKKSFIRDVWLDPTYASVNKTEITINCYKNVTDSISNKINKIYKQFQTPFRKDILQYELLKCTQLAAILKTQTQSSLQKNLNTCLSWQSINHSINYSSW